LLAALSPYIHCVADGPAAAYRDLANTPSNL
jgi:hypothetical protein